MDSLTHILIGAVAGEATLGKKIGNKAIYWGAFIGSIPDFDVFFSPFLKPVDGLFFHRGITHSFLFTIVFVPLLAWILQKVNKKSDTNYMDWALITFFAMLSHISVDFFNTYGTGYFEPFSNTRFAFDSMAIIDVFIIFPILLLLIPILVLNKTRNQRRLLAWFGIIFLIGYFTFSVLNKMNVEKIVKEQLASQMIDYNRILTSPLPLTNFMWIVIAESDKGYNLGYYCNFDQKQTIQFRYLARNAEYLNSIKNNEEIKDLIRFTKGYYKVDSISKNEVTVYDLRYGSLDFNDEKAYVFTFGIKETSTGVEITRAHPERSINFATTEKYFKRVFGKIGE